MQQSVRNVFLFVTLFVTFLNVTYAKEKGDYYWVGHLTPDTDSISSAIAAAYLYGGVATRTGKLNNETKFVLEYFNVDSPILVNDYSQKKVGLVDFNQKTQLHPTIKMVNILRIVDHHALRQASINTNVPIDIEIRPWGSTATILAFKLFDSEKPFPKDIAGILLAAVLSDTLLLTSPTTSESDRKAVEVLADKSGIIDVNEFGLKMLGAKSNLSMLTDREVLLSDFKTYEINSNVIGVGVAETVDPNSLLLRKQGLLKSMNDIKGEKSLDYIFFAVVDVINKRAYLFLVSVLETELAEVAFNGVLSVDTMTLDNIVSRKRQLLPKLEAALNREPNSS